MEDPMMNDDTPRLLQVLETLKQASRQLQIHSDDSSAIKALLELHTESDTILSKDRNLSSLSHHLTELKTLVDSFQNSQGISLRSFLTRRVSTHSISRLAGSIESEIQTWIDRESIDNLMAALRQPFSDGDELVKLLIHFEDRVSRGFDRELQDLVLKTKVFSTLEAILCDPKCSKRIREQSASGVTALIRFNKDVFVGQVFMGKTIRALVGMASTHSIKVLCSLIRSIKSPLVDEIESNGAIPKIISFLNYQDLEIKVLAMNCVLDIGYFGRKEAVQAMLKMGLINKLVELQRSDLGGALIDLGRNTEKEMAGVSAGGLDGRRANREKRFLESHPFASCASRFAVQLEVGEGLRQREKRAFKQEILLRVREACLSDAEAATILAEVLWGSSP